MGFMKSQALPWSPSEAILEFMRLRSSSNLAWQAVELTPVEPACRHIPMGEARGPLSDHGLSWTSHVVPGSRISQQSHRTKQNDNHPNTTSSQQKGSKAARVTLCVACWSQEAYSATGHMMHGHM